MNRRALPALIIVLAAIGGLFAIGGAAPPPAESFFATPPAAWMPAVSDTAVLTGNWFCPGVPATGEDGVGGEVIVANRDGEQLFGRFSILTPQGLEVTESLVVEPWSRATIDVDAFVTAEFASVVVEIDGGGGVVEQRAQHPAGDSVSPCATSTSAQWYFADGFTLDGSVETLILTNPYDEAAVVDLGFATLSGESTPAAFQGFTIPPQSVEAIRVAELGYRDEGVVAVQVSAQRGRLVVGRAQHYLGGGRLGYGITLAAPALRDQFWFADGEAGDGIVESFAIYNPTDTAAQVDVVFLGVPIDATYGDVQPIDVPAGRVVVYDPSDDTEITLPPGRHASVFSTLAAPSIVVERILTRRSGERVATSVVVGAPPRSDGFVASRWHVGLGPSSAAQQALVIYNIDNVESTVTVLAVGPGGPSAVPSLTDVPIGAGRVATIDLVADDVVDRELIVQSTSRVFVERTLPRGGALAGTSGSWALPADGD